MGLGERRRNINREKRTKHRQGTKGENKSNKKLGKVMINVNRSISDNTLEKGNEKQDNRVKGSNSSNNMVAVIIIILIRVGEMMIRIVRIMIRIMISVKEARATTRRDSPFQGTWKVNPEYLESLLSSSTFFY